MARRAEPEPPLLPAVSERLARLLAETAPGVAEPGGSPAVPPLVAGDAPERAPAEAPSSEPPQRRAAAGLLDVDEVAMPRRFSRRHAAVVVVLLLVGLLWAGWAVLRARPVALATPVAVSPAAPGQPAAPRAPAAPGASPPVGPAPSAAPQPGSPSSRSGGHPRGPGPPAGPPTGPEEVVVHVLGAVADPGLVTLRGRSRVQDAVEAAGGFRRDADPGDLNLAQLLVDGQQVVIGTRKRPAGEVRGTAGATGSAPGAANRTAPATRVGGAAGTSGPLDLNRATVAELDELPGVGPVTAAKIIAWREEHARFSSVAELQEVDGIGPKTYAEIAPHVGV